LLWAGGTAYSRLWDFAAMAEIAREVGARFAVDMAHVAGLVAGGAHPSPIPHADVVTTTTHKTLRGPRGGMILCRAAHASALDKAVFPGLQVDRMTTPPPESQSPFTKQRSRPSASTRKTWSRMPACLPRN